MHSFLRRPAALALGVAACIGLILSGRAVAQQAPASPPPAPTLTADDLVRRAFTANRELAAARIEQTRARARLQQAGLRPNPVLELEHVGGPLGISKGEEERRAELSLPIEYGGKRSGRIGLAEAELRAIDANVSDRERRLAAAVRTAHAEAVAARRELRFTEELVGIDADLDRILQARVREGDAAPLEANLLRVEIDRLRSRRALVEGRYRAAEMRLRSTVGLSAQEPLSLADAASADAMPVLDEAIALALSRRPDLRLAALNVEVAEAGLRLARAEALPELNVFGNYTNGRSGFDDTPVGPLTDRDQLFGAGVSITLPVFHRNQGVIAERSAAIEQARHLRDFTEAQVRAEVEGALARYHAAQTALDIFREGVIDRSAANVRTMRAAYETGAFSISELLAERRRFVDAQRDFTEALAERELALADLQAAIAAPIDTTKDVK
ncbi:MAG TPA: TolC family protein [Thermoanaerobaculia bacterium]|nr:TolC family protein [Thermoanaerobaculia bacterium]